MKRLFIITALAALSAPAAELVNLKVIPPDVNLEGARDRQRVVVQAEYDDLVTREVTAQCAFELADPTPAAWEAGRLVPRRDGETTLRVSFQGRRVEVPVRVRDTATERPVSFELDVLPVLSKSGCNSGGCHGSSRGQDGFRLSLFGYDPAGDYQRITREMGGRRINLAAPEESLLVQKGLGTVTHTGGDLFTRDSEHFATLVRWLRASAPADPTNLPRAVALELGPDRVVLGGKGATQQLTARVRYSDGTDRDVTENAVYISNNDPAAAVSKQGLVTAGQRGEAFVMARYETFTVGAQVIVMQEGQPYAWAGAPEFNYVDGHVYAKLRKLRMLPADLCTDAEFARRVHLDLIGRLPARAELDAFLADPAEDRRTKLVDALMQRKEFVDLWVMKWAELLQIRSNNEFSYKSAVLYFGWLRDRIARGEPLDRIVRELLAATGGTFKNPATNYYQVEVDPLKVAENAAQVFLGMRMQCAQCHNHPFDRWTMNDYYGFAAFFAQIGRKKGEDPRETVVFNQGSGETKHPVDKRDVAPAFLGGGPADVAGRDRRAVVADWLTSTNNTYFARNLANITWSHFFGRGIVEPVDDVRVSNPPSNPELLDALAGRLVGYGFDFRKLVRDVCLSRTYQHAGRANETNAGDERNFARARPRRIRAEVLLDCLSQVTGTENKFQGLPLGARAVEIADGTASTYFLKTFGRASRDTVCACEVVMEPSLSQALHLLNGETTHQKVTQGGVVKKLLEAKQEPAAIVDELYLRCLARRPTQMEQEALLASVAAAENKQQALEDVFWALLNAKEFVFNH